MYVLQDGAVEAMRKVRVLAYTGVCSFIFSLAKWFFQGSDYACGFGVWPTFGMAAMKYTWNFDWQLNYVGAGRLVICSDWQVIQDSANDVCQYAMAAAGLTLNPLGHACCSFPTC